MAAEDEEVDEGSRSTGKRPMASQSCGATSGYKRKRRERAQSMVTEKIDPMMALMGEVWGDLKSVSAHIGTMAAAAERDLQIQEKASEEDPKKKLNEQALKYLNKLGFSEVVKCARVFVKEPDEITMMFAVPENLRREYVIAMLKAAEEKRKD